MQRIVITVGGIALGITLAGCGTNNAINHIPKHHSSANPHTRSTRHAPHTGRPQTQSSGPQWWRLPLRSRFSEPTMISAISPEPKTSMLRLYLTSYPNAQDTVHGTVHAVSWDPHSQSLGSPVLFTAGVPHDSVAFRLISTNSSTPQPQLMDGSAPAQVSWPTAVATYQSGANPASSPFQMDNRVIGQSGKWIWIALKGPHHVSWTFSAGVWGFRHWNRVVALNTSTAQYRVFSLPQSHSETLTYPLWLTTPAFTATRHHVYIGVGDFIGEFPVNPATAAPPTVHGAPSATRTATRIRQALNVINQASWQSVNADAAFWNCYVMKDASSHACPNGTGLPPGTALSQSPTFFNHASIGFPLIWASLLPMPSRQADQRTAAMTRLHQALKASLMMDWIGHPSASALRRQFPSGPPSPLPGYYRKQGLYWAIATTP